jgi:hypothetical protein
MAKGIIFIISRAAHEEKVSRAKSFIELSFATVSNGAFGSRVLMKILSFSHLTSLSSVRHHDASALILIIER